MILKTKSKIICAVLTVTLALSPVCMIPAGASDGQDVEEQASSWRYQDGDIIVDEGVTYLEADENLNLDIMQDYNAQMGSSLEEEQIEEPAAKADETQQEETQPEELAGEPAENADEELTDDPEVTEEATEEVTEELAEDPEATEEAVEPEIQEPEAAESAEGEIAVRSATKKDRYWTWNSGKEKRGPGYYKGIDVSYWQGNINWKKVKNAGVDFAIIRCGYGPNKSSKDDSYFAANVAGCVANDIPYGVYLYSYANTVSEAKDEADHALRLLQKNNCRPKYPVYYDLEDKQVASASNATIVKMANAFCKKLTDNGYAPGVYANLTWWNNKLANFTGYDRWVAQWAKTCTYKKEYSVWQCTSSASVSGISGRIDANLQMVPKTSMDDYMRNNGVRYTLTEIDGNTYAVSSFGDIVKNRFLKIGYYTYGFGEDGIMLKDQKPWLGHKSYILDSKGRAYINKSKTIKDAPYYAKKGSDKQGTLEAGTSFYVLRTSGDWSKMADGNWIKTSLTKKTIRYPNVKPSKTVNYKAVLKETTVSRSGPSTKYLKKKIFKKGVTVTVIGTYGKWSKLSTKQWLPSGKLRKK